MNHEDYAGKTILFIVPHADDLHYQAGGTAALWASHGARVISIAITDSARGTRQLGADLERMKIIGELEARRAAGVTGLSEVIFLGYPDGFLHAVPYLNLREQFIGLIRRYQPQIVVTWDPFNPREPNPDHRHAAPAVYDAACFADYPLFYPEQLREGISLWPVAEIWLLSNFPEILDQYVDITPVIEVKVQALLEYEKDMHLAVDDLRRPLEAADPNSPLIPKLQRERYREIMGTFVRERARDLGNRCGCQYAEGFRTIHLGFPYDFKGFHEWLEKWIPER